MRPIARTVTAEEMQRLGPILKESMKTKPEEWLNKFGATMYALLVNSNKSNDLIHLLWKRYLADCKRHSVKPFEPAPGSEVGS